MWAGRNKVRFFAWLFLTLSAALFPRALSASKSNDFTKANLSFSKKFITDKSADFDKKSRFNDREFESKEFSAPDNASWIREREFIGPDSPLSEELSGRRAYDNKKTFDDIPDGAPKRRNWSKSDTELNLKSKNEILNKEYEGRLDFDNRPDFYGEKFLQENYGEMIEKSMQDINKYYFRSSRSTDSGIPTSVAGGDLRKDESSIFDFLSSDKKIERPSVVLKGPAKGLMDSTSIPSSRVESPQISPIPDSAAHSALSTQPVQQPAGKNLSSSASSAQPPARQYNTREIIRENVDQKVIDTFDFMRVPEGWKSGAPSIKVEVRDE